MRAPPMFAFVSVLLGTTAAVAAPPTAGTVAVTLADPDADTAPDDQDYADAVAQALGAANFTLLSDHSRYVAEVQVDRAYRGVVTTRVSRQPASVGAGGAGPAISLPLGSRKTALRDLVATTLTVRLMTRGTRTPVWAGSAMTAAVDGAPVAAKLARAALAAYPQTFDRTVSVP